jgi:hypothetical protein
MQRAEHNGDGGHGQTSGYVALLIRLPNAPSSTRNSPVNPLVVGSPIAASVSTMKKTEYTGRIFASQP